MTEPNPTAPTPTAPRGRRPVVPIVLGFLVVAAVIAIGLLVVRVTDDGTELPDRLVGGYSATDLVDEDQFDDREDAERVADQQSELMGSSEELLEETLEEPVTVRGYQTEDAQSQVTLTIVDAADGPFAPNGPQPGPELLGMERGPYELVRDGDAVCNLSWSAVVAEDEAVPDGDPVGLHCQLGAEGRTYWLNGRGLSVDDAVEILESVSD